jgi:hypothetical protein
MKNGSIKVQERDMIREAKIHIEDYNFNMWTLEAFKHIAHNRSESKVYLIMSRLLWSKRWVDRAKWKSVCIARAKHWIKTTVYSSSNNNSNNNSGNC